MHILSNLESCLMSEEILARAYEHTSAARRAWIKKQIAHLCACYPADHCLDKETLCRLDGSFSRTSISRHLDFAGLILGSTLPAWNKVLALLVPAVMNHASATAIFITGKKPEEVPADFLTALELAGIEDIYLVSSNLLHTWLHGLDRSLQAAFFVPDSGTSEELAWNLLPGKVKKLALPWKSGLKAGVWAGKQLDWDWDVISWANPDVHFMVAGEQARLAPPAFEVLELDRAEFLDLDMDVFFGPRDLFLQTRAFLGLYPGMEACWIWPGLDPAFFYFHREFWSRPGADAPEN